MGEERLPNVLYINHGDGNCERLCDISEIPNLTTNPIGESEPKVIINPTKTYTCTMELTMPRRDIQRMFNCLLWGWRSKGPLRYRQLLRRYDYRHRKWGEKI